MRLYVLFFAHKVIAQVFPPIHHALDECLYFRIYGQAVVHLVVCLLITPRPILQGLEVDLLSLEIRFLEVVFDSSVQIPLHVATVGFLREPRIPESLVPLGIPLGEKGNQVVIGVHGEALQITSTGALRDRREFCIPSHVPRLILEPTGTCDGVEMQRVSQYKHAILKARFVGIDYKLHLVFPRREEEGFQIVKAIDSRCWHGVDGSKDNFPCLRRFSDIDVGQNTGSIGGRLRRDEHVPNDRGYERQDALVSVEVEGPCNTDDHICVISAENRR